MGLLAGGDQFALVVSGIWRGLIRLIRGGCLDFLARMILRLAGLLLNGLIIRRRGSSPTGLLRMQYGKNAKKLQGQNQLGPAESEHGNIPGSAYAIRGAGDHT